MPLQSDHSVIYGERVKADYRAYPCEWGEGNPLLEALPFPFEDIRDLEVLLGTPALRRPDHITQSRFVRTLNCLGVGKLWVPMGQHFDLCEALHHLIHAGYEHRNPLRRRTWTRTGDAAAEALRRLAEQRRTRESRAAPFQPVHADALTVRGLSGTGKTTTLVRSLSLLPQVIEHDSYPNNGGVRPLRDGQQVVWIVLNCPYKGSIRAFCIMFFHVMDALCGTNYEKAYGSLPSVDLLMPRVASVAHAHGLGVLIIDEFQFLKTAPGANADDMMKFIATLMNTVRFPIVFAGTDDIGSVINRHLYTARRTSSSGALGIDRLASLDELRMLVEPLWDAVPLRENPTFAELCSEDDCVRERLVKRGLPLANEVLMLVEQLTAGVQALVSSLLVGAARLALLLHDEALTLSHLEGAAERAFRYIAPSVEEIRRSGQPFDAKAYAEQVLKLTDNPDPIPVPHAVEASGPVAKAAAPKKRRKRTQQPAPAPVSEEVMREAHEGYSVRGAVATLDDLMGGE